MINLTRNSKPVAVYLPSLEGGGAERVMVILANGLAQRGHRVDLILAKAEGPYLAEVAPEVRVVDLASRRVLASLPRLISYLQRERPRAILSALNHANLVMIIARELSGTSCRLVISERRSASGDPPGFTTFATHWLMRRLYSRADKVIAVAQALADELITEFGLPSERVIAIPNPVDVDGIRALATENIDHPWVGSDEPPLFLAVGRLAVEKDYPTLLQAFAKVHTKRPCRLLILGEGELRSQLSDTIRALGLSDSAQLLGFQSNPYKWMRACAVYVMSSQAEGFPNSLAQAMACGARIVSTDCKTGPNEILEAGKWGALVPVGDPDALAQAMEAALEHPNPMEGTRRVEDFQPHQIIAMYENALMLEGTLD